MNSKNCINFYVRNFKKNVLFRFSLYNASVFFGLCHLRLGRKITEKSLKQKLCKTLEYCFDNERTLTDFLNTFVLLPQVCVCPNFTSNTEGQHRLFCW